MDSWSRYPLFCGWLLFRGACLYVGFLWGLWNYTEGVFEDES